MATRRGFGRTRKLPSGRWQAFYRDPDGRTTTSRSGKTTPVRHSAPVTYDTKLDAEAWLIDEHRLISSGTWTPPARRRDERRASTVTFAEYAVAWIPARRVKGRPLADRTKDHYLDLLDRFILPTFGPKALTDITTEDVDHWYDLVAIDKPTTRAHAYSLLRTILGSAASAKPKPLIPTNPASIRGAGTSARVHKVKTASLQELAVMVAAMPERRRLMISLAAWCALRFGELAELRRDDIDTKTWTIKVRRGVVKVRATDADGEAIWTRKVKGPKSDAGKRDVIIPRHLRDDVKDHLSRFCDPGKAGLLFPGAPGRQMYSSAFYGHAAVLDDQGKVLRAGYGYFEARRLAGRPDLRFHDLRHTGLTNAAQVGATVAELMAMAGHSSSAASLRYQHAAEDRMAAIADRLSDLAEGQK